MNGDRTADVLFYGLFLLLPLSALFARRLPIGSVMKMAVAWIAIFGLALLVVSQRARFDGIANLFSDQRASGGETRIRMASDGHFWADVTIDGASRRMLIDSGATLTALSIATAKAAGLDVERNPFPEIIRTANGEVVAQCATAKRVTVGTVVVDNVGVVVASEFGDTDLLGMNFLSRLGSWRVEGRTLVLNTN